VSHPPIPTDYPLTKPVQWTSTTLANQADHLHADKRGTLPSEGPMFVLQGGRNWVVCWDILTGEEFWHRPLDEHETPQRIPEGWLADGVVMFASGADYPVTYIHPRQR
jgi:outer membrane protein assembly factor BamB